MMADLENKLLAIDKMANIAKTLIETNSQILELQALISARSWGTTGAPKDDELLSRGITAANVTAMVGFMTQFSKLMAGSAVTTTQGTVICNGIKAL